MKCSNCKTFIPKGNICFVCGHENEKKFSSSESRVCPHCGVKANPAHFDKCPQSPEAQKRKQINHNIKKNIGWYPNDLNYRADFKDKLKAAKEKVEIDNDVSGFTFVLDNTIPEHQKKRFIDVIVKEFNLRYNKNNKNFRKGNRELPAEVDYNYISDQIFRQTYSQKKPDGVTIPKGSISGPDAVSEALDLLVFYRRHLDNDHLGCLEEIIQSARSKK